MILPTIKSRTLIIHFQKIQDDEMINFLEKNLKMTNISKDIIDILQGSISKAIELKESEVNYEEIKEFTLNIERCDMINLLNTSNTIFSNKEKIYDILDYINVILLKLAIKDNKYTNCIQIVEETKKRIKQNANYDMSIDNMLIKLWEEIN